MINKLLVATLLMTTVVIAQQGRGFGKVRMGWDDQLALSPQQVEQIQKSRMEFETKAIDLRAELQKLRLELRGQVRADKPSKRTIDATLDKIAAQQAALAKLRVEHHLEVRDLLTDEQKQVFDARPFGRGGKGFSGHSRGRGRRW
ncbi:MAG: periplasmic heavy metal sensor [Fidelibacterota bacterium]|nr:MAG: periplasmic heavy metal sensor [Candidatus Neomarinimicrobiota bacterium]